MKKIQFLRRPLTGSVICTCQKIKDGLPTPKRKLSASFLFTLF